MGESGEKQKDLEDLQARDGGGFDSSGGREVRFSEYVLKLKVF